MYSVDHRVSICNTYAKYASQKFRYKEFHPQQCHVKQKYKQLSDRFCAVQNENTKTLYLTEEKLDDAGARTELGSESICPVCLLNVGR